MYGKEFDWKQVRFLQNKDNGGNAYECFGDKLQSCKDRGYS